MTIRLVLGASLAVALAFASTSFAQDRASHNFLKAAIEGNLAEVQMGQLAQKNGNSDGVRSFGQMLENDHGAAHPLIDRRNVGSWGTRCNRNRSQTDDMEASPVHERWHRIRPDHGFDAVGFRLSDGRTLGRYFVRLISGRGGDAEATVSPQLRL
jgi:Domain of unknown function (DUF4142)